MLPDGYEIRALNEADAPWLAAAYRRNRDHLAPWEPIRGEAFYTGDGQAAAARAMLEAAAEGTQDPWLIMHGADVVGRVTLSNIVRGMFLSANIGYWTDLAHTGRGLATEAVGFAVRRADELGLHRVEAGTLALNLASQRGSGRITKSSSESSTTAPRECGDSETTAVTTHYSGRAEPE